MSVRFFINFAFSANTSYSSVNGSLYTLGFGNRAGVFCFDLDGDLLSGISGPRNIMQNIDGSYRSLGFLHGLPEIDYADLISAVVELSEFNADRGRMNAIRGSLARLIIAINEAIRFDMVANAIDQVIRGTHYRPPCRLIHNWGGSFIGS
ncbi:ribosome-inactivating family protein [Endozoicomonas sp.]|uniref:ribosome-inactivating family protein n=1 Tax=Endozoicomonas sp. TaxID=1892382 RepID=UPI003839FA88